MLNELGLSFGSWGVLCYICSSGATNSQTRKEMSGSLKLNSKTLRGYLLPLLNSGMVKCTIVSGVITSTTVKTSIRRRVLSAIDLSSSVSPHTPLPSLARKGTSTRKKKPSSKSSSKQELCPIDKDETGVLRHLIGLEFYEMNADVRKGILKNAKRWVEKDLVGIDISYEIKRCHEARMDCLPGKRKDAYRSLCTWLRNAKNNRWGSGAPDFKPHSGHSKSSTPKSHLNPVESSRLDVLLKELDWDKCMLPDLSCEMPDSDRVVFTELYGLIEKERGRA